MEAATISARVDKKIVKKLDVLAESTSRTRSFLIAEAIQTYLEEQEWQIEAIKEGVKQADNEDFVDDDEVKKLFSGWGVNAD